MRLRLCPAALGIDDVDIQRRGTKQPGTNKPTRFGLRWIVESTNSWLSNYGQLRRNTDRRSAHRAHRRLATRLPRPLEPQMNAYPRGSLSHG